MSVEKDSNEQKVEALRALGYDEAADDLALLYEDDAKRAQEQAEAKRKAGPPGIPLLAEIAFDRQAEREGHIILDALRQSGVGRTGRYSLPLFDEPERGAR